MMTRIVLFACVGCFVSLELHAQEQESAEEDPAHDELRALRDAILEAVETDFDAALLLMHDNVVVTRQDGAVNRGRDELREYHERMMVGPDRIVDSVKHELTVDELSILFGGDTAIAFGDLVQDYKLADGRNFKLNSRWTVTAVKEDGKWLVASAHISANVFDNALLWLYLYRAAGAAGALGLVLGILLTLVVTRLRKRKSS